MSDVTMPFTAMTRGDFQSHLDERSVNTHDGSAVARWFAEDGVQRRIGTGQVATGPAEVRDAMDAMFRAFPDFHVEVHGVFSAGDRMCAECTVTGTHRGDLEGLPPTGRRIEMAICLVFRFGPDGLVQEENLYGDSATMLRQLGVM